MNARWIFIPACAPGLKLWNGNTVLSESLGGSEAAVAYLAQALARKGNDVTVVTNGDPCTDWTGVKYYNQASLAQLVAEEWDYVISSRWPEALMWPWKSKGLILWLHDMPPQQRIEIRCNLLVFISEFQRAAYGANEHCAVIGDGVDNGMVKNLTLPKERDPNKLIWTSNPDRGLAVAARILQEVRKRWPEVTLHVFGRASVYGWDASAENAYMPREKDRPGVILHDPLPRPALLKELAHSWAFFYPTWWPETFCMAALEAQAVGTPVIASPYGALTETVKGGILSYDFLNSVSQLRNVRRWNKLSVLGMEWARKNTWDIVADKWIEAIEKEAVK